MDASANLFMAWLWILLGFASGLVLGSFFHRENWLGGYGSFKRRMYRLTHISFFGLGAVNLLFWLTARNFALPENLAHWASWGFLIGAVSMPVCCLLMARWPGLRLLFAIPVISLMAAGALTLIGVSEVEGAWRVDRISLMQNSVQYKRNAARSDSAHFTGPVPPKRNL